METKAVIFDIDGTLTKEISWSYLAVKLEASPEEDLEIYHKHRAGKLTDAEADARILKMWTARGPVSKKRFIEVFDSIPLRPEAFELIKNLKQKGKIICLITGSMDLYAQMIAKKFGVEHYFWNADLFWDAENNILNFNYTADQGSKKLKQLKKFCQDQNLALEECAVIGDSENDIEIFKATKKGIAVKTEFEEKELEKEAWKVVDNLAAINQIINES